MRNARPVRLYIFDADDTLRRTTVEGQPCPNKPGEWEVIPGVRERLTEIDWSVSGARFGIASNQGGVGMGYMTYEMARRLLADMVVDAFGVKAAPHGSIEICPHAPHANCPCRKPKPLMLVRLMHRFHAHRNETLFIGDMDRDEEAARRAGVGFLWAHEFFNRQNAVEEKEHIPTLNVRTPSQQM
ncbi:MAG TPA: HAD-IIIA family hydrolase [Pyrinomonadaceae bacterium]|jgi:D-glycero-D-manno-heptose 1,7-bisphosphate phosphatase|nr:HAD-IIIA family hydrolase [Pyrinomonadaceae bacterium]